MSLVGGYLTHLKGYSKTKFDVNQMLVPVIILGPFFWPSEVFLIVAKFWDKFCFL